MKATLLQRVRNLFFIVLAGALFGLGFDMFLETVNINCGGLSGIGMIIKQLSGRDTFFGFDTVAFFSFVLNIPLFILGYRALGRDFLIGTLLTTFMVSLFLQLFLPLQHAMAGQTDRLLHAIFGGVLIGLAVGASSMAGASTGGTDIVARLLKLHFRNLPIGMLLMSVDVVIITVTGIVYRDITSTLYSAVTLYVSSMVIDAVVYRFDYTKVVLIITDQYDEVADAIGNKLHRGVTMLRAQGYYRRTDKFVLLSAVKRHQLAELQQLVNEIDPNAFVIVQEAHKVLGDGFKHYSEKSL